MRPVADQASTHVFNYIHNKHTPMKYQIYTARITVNTTKSVKCLRKNLRSIDVVAHVLPFKTKNYVVMNSSTGTLSKRPHFHLTSRKKECSVPSIFPKMAQGVDAGATPPTLRKTADQKRHQLIHPAGQSHNVPEVNGEKLTGAQHTIQRTMLFFPPRDKPVTPIAPSAFAGPNSRHGNNESLPERNRQCDCLFASA